MKKFRQEMTLHETFISTVIRVLNVEWSDMDDIYTADEWGSPMDEHVKEGTFVLKMRKDKPGCCSTKGLFDNDL